MKIECSKCASIIETEWDKVALLAGKLSVAKLALDDIWNSDQLSGELRDKVAQTLEIINQ